MPSVADRIAPVVSSTTPSSGRRIINRITSPFASRPRNVTDFHIEPDDPHKQYSPGDVVTGSVLLKVVKPVRVTHITVCLHGFVQVYKNPNGPGDAHRENYLGLGKGSKSGEYFGNGFATLFEDEVVLCGDGRLAEGPYQFNFELLFPDKDLPSSLDFERGTISYLITATLTRPTTINPMITCERKVFFLETIDIASLYPPKARTITLSPVSRRTKAKHTARKLVDPSEKRSKKTDSGTPSDLQRGSQGSGSALSNGASTRRESEVAQSPAPSEQSFESTHDSTATDHYTQHSGSSDNDRTTTSKSSGSDKAIVTTMEVLQGGCLRGDYVPVRVVINHTKAVKSLYGIIVTLFRHARVDMHPDIPLGPTVKGKDAKYEDYFPKSFTGLGGLSLSGAGSSHTFRKDLQQTFKPILIDPVTLSTTVNAAVRVPEEAFPTMATVPGGMISFKYYVEVVVDIQGKLAGSDKGLSSLGGLTSPHVNISDAYDGERSAFTPFGSNILDTAPMKRYQNVINCTFELVVGTRDSERRRGKRKLEIVAVPEAEPAQAEGQPKQQTQAELGAQQHRQADDTTQQANQYADHAWGPGQWYWQPYEHVDGYDYGPQEDWNQYQDGWSYQQYDQPPQSDAVPIPSMPDESHMSEKERIRQQEMRLLPSQPPGVEQNGESSLQQQQQQQASAPYLPEEGPAGPSNEAVVAASAGPSAPPAEQLAGFYPPAPNHTPAPTVRGQRLPSVPAYEPPSAGPSSSRARAVPVTDDKQELERQRLQMEASAPPADGEEREAEDGEAEPARVPQLEPAAPYFHQQHASRLEHDAHGDAVGEAEMLPMYER